MSRKLAKLRFARFAGIRPMNMQCRKLENPVDFLASRATPYNAVRPQKPLASGGPRACAL